MSKSRPHKAVFLDRDGTIIEDTKFSTDPATLRPLAGALDGLRRLREAGYLLVVVTNQSGVARGTFDEASLQRFHEYMLRWFAERGVAIEAIYYCPHYPEGKLAPFARTCDCRKPAPGMLLKAAKEHGINLAESWMIGDRPADMGAGRAAGCRTIRVGTGDPAPEDHPEPDFYAPDLSTAAQLILGAVG